MIFLLGGTSETKAIATALASSGFRVMASTATDNELDVGAHPLITRRIGRLNEDEMTRLLVESKAVAVVDASHPFAEALHETAKNAASRFGAPYFRFERAGIQDDIGCVHYVKDHDEAAKLAFSFSKTVLLTTGSRNLAPYVELSKKEEIPVIARVLPHPESEEACNKAGLARENVIAARGPFSVEENLDLMARFKIGVLVTKDSGGAGGVPEKIEAARIAGCEVVMIQKPDSVTVQVFSRAEELVEAVCAALGGNGKNW